MIDLRFRPLKHWPEEQPKLARRGDAFQTRWPGTLEKLEHELKHLRATNIAIEAGFSHNDIRNHGWPMGGREPEHPGVILSFVKGQQSLQFPCGTYKRWQANIHAIALTLENLRAIDRYGVTVGHQQYAGFAQLAAPPWLMSAEEAAGLVIGIARPNLSADALIPLMLQDASLFNLYYRQAAGAVHPDSTSGDRSTWDRLEIAKGILDKHYAGAS